MAEIMHDIKKILNEEEIQDIEKMSDSATKEMLFTLVNNVLNNLDNKDLILGVSTQFILGTFSEKEELFKIFKRISGSASYPRSLFTKVIEFVCDNINWEIFTVGSLSWILKLANYGVKVFDGCLFILRETNENYRGIVVNDHICTPVTINVTDVKHIGDSDDPGYISITEELQVPLTVLTTKICVGLEELDTI
jgi:hypothetical protein